MGSAICPPLSPLPIVKTGASGLAIEGMPTAGASATTAASGAASRGPMAPFPTKIPKANTQITAAEASAPVRAGRSGKRVGRGADRSAVSADMTRRLTASTEVVGSRASVAASRDSACNSATSEAHREQTRRCSVSSGLSVIGRRASRCASNAVIASRHLIRLIPRSV